MATGLRVRVVITQDGSVIDRTFDRSPVRIGRSPLNELQLQFGFVSLYHAVLEFDDKHVYLRDLGSTNGTALRTTGRMPPNSAVDLTAHNYEFAIVSLWFQLFLIKDVVSPTVEKKREGTVLSLSVDELTRVGVPETQRRAPGADRSKQLMERIQPLYDQYRASWATLYREVQAVTNPLDAGARAPFLEQLGTEMAAVKNEQDFQRLAGYFGSPPEATVDARKGGPVADQHVALQALRDLAHYYVPQRGQLERTVDVVAFAQRLQDVLDVFFKCFLPLRDGHKQFKTQLDIQKNANPRAPITASRRVETAREPRELAAGLLDWTDSSNEAPRAVESTFAEIMVHQVAMLSGVMRGVRSLLQKLAPPSIEAELENPRRKARGGMQVGPFRYKVLWELYEEVYGDFAEDEKQAFALIFGPEFAHAYSELAGGDAAPPAQAQAPSAFPSGQAAPNQPPYGPPGPAPGQPVPARPTVHNPQQQWPGQWPPGQPPRR